MKEMNGSNESNSTDSIKKQIESYVESVFSKYDIDNIGEIYKTSVRLMLREQREQNNLPDLTDDEFINILSAIDTNGNG